MSAVVKDWPPSRVKIGCFNVTIEVYPAKDASEEQNFGKWSSLQQHIRVAADIEPGKILDTVLHELNHAVWFIFGIEDGDKEERVVGWLATAWATIFRDNPALVDWIRRESRRLNSAP